MNEFLDALMRGGPWTLLIVCFYTIRTMYYDGKAKDAAHAVELKTIHETHATEKAKDRKDQDAEKQRLNDRIIEAVQEQTKLLTNVTTTQRQIIAALKSVPKAEAHAGTDATDVVPTQSGRRSVVPR